MGEFRPPRWPVKFQAGRWLREGLGCYGLLWPGLPQWGWMHRRRRMVAEQGSWFCLPWPASLLGRQQRGGQQMTVEVQLRPGFAATLLPIWTPLPPPLPQHTCSTAEAGASRQGVGFALREGLTQLLGVRRPGPPSLRRADRPGRAGWCWGISHEDLLLLLPWLLCQKLPSSRRGA